MIILKYIHIYRLKKSITRLFSRLVSRVLAGRVKSKSPCPGRVHAATEADSGSSDTANYDINYEDRVEKSDAVVSRMCMQNIIFT